MLFWSLCVCVCVCHMQVVILSDLNGIMTKLILLKELFPAGVMIPMYTCLWVPHLWIARQHGAPQPTTMPI